MRSLIAKSLSPETQSNVLSVPSFLCGHKLPTQALALGAMTCAVLGVAPLASFTAARAQAAEVDARGPIVSILSPQYSAELKGTVQILVGIEARQNTPQTVELLVDGQTASNGAMALQSYPSANYNWDTTIFADGPHRLTVIVTDTQGFRGSADVNVYINNDNKRDLTPPALEWLGTQDGDTWRGIVDVKLKVSDNFGVKYLLLTLNPAATPDKKPAAFAWFLNRPPYSASFDSRKAPDGVYTLRALSYDALENEGSAPSINVTIANNAINPTTMPRTAQTTVPKAATPKADVTRANVPKTATPAPETATPTNGEAIVIEAPQGANSGQRLTSAPEARRATPQLSRPMMKNDAPNGVRTVPTEAPAAEHTPRDESSNLTTGGRLNSNDLLALAPRPSAQPIVPQISKAAPVQNSVVSRPGVAVATPQSAPSHTAPAADSASLLTMKERTLSPAAQEQLRIARAESIRANGAQLSGGNDARDGSISAPPVAAAANDTRELNGKVLLPTASTRVLMARATTPTNTGALVPLAPSRLPASNNGKVAVNAPVFPNANLAGDATQRASSPLVAAVPSPSVLKNVARAAITVAPLPPGAPGSLPTFHTAAKGETLTSISRRYKLPIDVVASHNKVAPNVMLSAGQKVTLPQTLAISYQGKPVTGDVAAMMVGSTGVTPFRFLFEKQGGKLEWDSKNHRVTARNSTHQVTLNIGDDKAMVNEKEVMMDLAAFLVSGRTMVPLRFFESALQANVEWEPATGRLFVAMAH